MTIRGLDAWLTTDPHADAPNDRHETPDGRMVFYDEKKQTVTFTNDDGEESCIHIADPDA